MFTSFEQICTAHAGNTIQPHAVFSVADTRALEAHCAQQYSPTFLMQEAGLALAQFTMAHCPHARHIWIACGPGNNAGDGYEAAVHLLQFGKTVHIAEAPDTPPSKLAQMAREKARQAGALFLHHPPQDYDVVLDALFGIGLKKPISGVYAQWIHQINQREPRQVVISVDIPSGLHADNGTCTGPSIKANLTLCLLTLKPGLLTADGRDLCGDIWYHALGMSCPSKAIAALNAQPQARSRPHSSNKGSFGDVVVIGGATGMAGAATLAATAALHAGAGRVYRVLLDETPSVISTPLDASIMTRSFRESPLETATTVAGCGGGTAIEHVLPELIQRAKNLVLDADGLNAVAQNTELAKLLQSRPPQSTIITPHPLEAARLLGCSVGAIQSDRLHSASELSHQFRCTVILKGSGSIISAPEHTPHINITGNARLATAGTGDVLAGMVGAFWAVGTSPFEAACRATYIHGHMADTWPAQTTLTASRLAQSVRNF
jgi:ADP-dependent NAD(P)H-hydrate dehydratase / NAD(P)H-hydrate epimerase